MSRQTSPDFETILRVVRALGMKLHAEAVGA
jgi:DNA-binding phage protein